MAHAQYMYQFSPQGHEKLRLQLPRIALLHQSGQTITHRKPSYAAKDRYRVLRIVPQPIY